MPNIRDSAVVLEAITGGVRDIPDAVEAMDRVLANIAAVIKDLQNEAEKVGHAPEVTMERLDNLVDALTQRVHMITAAIIENSELDDDV